MTGVVNEIKNWHLFTDVFGDEYDMHDAVIKRFDLNGDRLTVVVNTVYEVVNGMVYDITIHFSKLIRFDYKTEIGNDYVYGIEVEKNDYFASEILNDLGLVNVASDNSTFNELSMEAILSADPDYIFVIPRGDEKKALKSLEESFTGNPSWENLSAVKNGHFSILSKDLFGLKPNNRWDEAYEEAYRLLYQ